VLLIPIMKFAPMLPLLACGFLLSCASEPPTEAPLPAGAPGAGMPLRDGVAAALRPLEKKDPLVVCFLPVLQDDVIRRGVEEAIKDMDGKAAAGGVEAQQWRKIFRPIYQRVAKTGLLPPGVSVQAGRITRETRNGAAMEEKLHLRLDVHKLAPTQPGFSLPIVRYVLSWKLGQY
jgi:hypothetical protein